MEEIDVFVQNGLNIPVPKIQRRCDCCWLLEKTEHAESTRHISLECPTASILMDACARAFAATVKWPIAASVTTRNLLKEIGGAMITGFRGAIKPKGKKEQGPIGEAASGSSDS